jgi:FkbM family methyltransferase
MGEELIYKTIGEAKGNRVAIDIGANVGHYTEYMAKIFPKVIAVEPHPENIKTLIEKTAKFPNVEIWKGVVGGSDGQTKLYINSNPGGHSISKVVAECKTFGHDLEKFIDVRSWRLDTIAEGLDIGVIKIDVEGAEVEVLRSGVETLKRCHPLIGLEVHQTVDLKELAALLALLHYNAIGDAGPATTFEYDHHYKLY